MMGKRATGSGTFRRGGRLLLTTSVAVLALSPLPALAQQDAAQPGASTAGLADIIVTASRREENVQKESREIAVLGAEQLERQGITNALDAQKLVPGFTVSQNGSQLQVSIRGVGDRTISSETDPAVSLNVDGVYFPRSYEAANFFFDLDRIEVLKGPQGTLYGRNASAGAVNMVVAKPRFETSGFLEGELGNYDQKRLTGAINWSPNDKMAFRLSGQWVDRDGYLTDGYNDDKNHALRFQARFEPTDSDSLLFTAAYSHRGGKGQAATITRGSLTDLTDFSKESGLTPGLPVPPLPSNKWTGPTDPAMLAYLDVNDAGGARVLRQVGKDGFVDLNVYLLSATYEHRFDWGTFTLLPAFVGSKLNEINFGGLVVPTQETSRSHHYSIEARLAAPDGARVKWVVGAFAAAENLNDYRQSLIPILPTNAIDSVVVIPKLNDRTWAVFGEANASLTDRFRVIAGARYTWEKKFTDGYVGTVGLEFDPDAGMLINPSEFPLKESDADYPLTGPTVAGRLVDHAFNYRLGVEYDIAPQSMLYATVSTGFKAGGFFAYLAPYNSYKPERLTAFQGGIKNRLFDNRLQLNVEGFYWKYKNKQETFLANFGPPYGNVLDTANAGRVTLYGVDVSLVGQITRNDVLSADVEYLHSKYDRFVYSFVGTPDPTINCGSATDGTTVTEDCSGHSLIRAPKWAGHVGYQHTQPLGDDAGRLILNADMRFSSSYWLSNNFTLITRAGAYQTYDASLTWESPNGQFSVTGFIHNIGNIAIYNGGVASASQTDVAVGQIEPPRTFGGRVRVKF